MIRMEGKSVSGGVAQGPLFFLHRHREDPCQDTGKPEKGQDQDQVALFLQARERAVSSLAVLADRARAQAGEETARLFEAHQIMAGDPELEAAVLQMIREQGCSAGQALQSVRDQFCAVLEGAEDEDFRARGADVRDVTQRILDELAGGGQELPDLPGPVILAADDLSPSETIRLDREKLLGLILTGGSERGHTAILARSLQIPAVIGLGQIPAQAGTQLILDGDKGLVILDPDAQTRMAYRLGSEEKRGLADREREAERGSGRSADPAGLRICCNMTCAAELPAVLASGARGVGLFRSEFLFLGSRELPSEEEQLQAYRRVLTGMAGGEVIIRTLDIGGDKQAPCIALEREDNPALGLRGIRLCLARPQLLHTQLRALYRASVYGRLGIMIPMVTSVWELQSFREICLQVQEELRREGIPFRADVPLGVMIETPAAALISDELAREADFFSCGTNDLTQYTLACDRQNRQMDPYSDPRHPAVLALIRMACESARRRGIPFAVCGELAGDLSMTDFFLELGVDVLSVSPDRVPLLRERIRECQSASIHEGSEKGRRSSC